MYTLIRDGFARDIIVALILSIMIGSGLTWGVARAANRFFGDTVSGLVGDYGEYDVAVHVRAEVRRDARRALETLLAEEFRGSRMKESLTVLSRSNFFISLGEGRDERRLTGLVRALSDIPGYAGYTVMLEPRVTVSGLGARVAPILRERFNDIPGVVFTFREGSDIHLVCETSEATLGVEQAANDILREYQVLDVRLREGESPESKADVVARIRSVFSARTGQGPAPELFDVTPEGGKEESEHLVATLTEIRSFLEKWTTQASIRIDSSPADNRELRVGDILAISDGSLTPGTEVDSETALVRLVGTDGRRTGRAILIRPGTGDRPAGEYGAYYVNDGVIGAKVGVATLVSPQVELVNSLDDTERLLGSFDTVIREALETARGSEEALARYENALTSLITLQRALESIGIGDPGSIRVDPDAVDMLIEATGRAVAALETLEEVAAGVTPFTRSYDPLLHNIELWMRRLGSLHDRLATLQSAVEGAGEVASVLDDISRAAEGILVTLQELDAATLAESVAAMRADLEEMSSVDVDSMIEQVRAVRNSLPSLTDQEMASSIGLIDRFIGNQLVPGDRIQILIRHGGSHKAVQERALDAAGAPAATAYSLPAGVVQPGVRSEIHRLLGNVRTTIAGIVAVVFTIASLLFDHASVISGVAHLRHVAGEPRPGLAGWVYGGAAGAATLGAISAITRASVGSMTPAYMVGIGMALGFVAASIAVRTSPVSREEVEACLACGTSSADVMREIVIPSGKPGILSLLNRSRLRFAGQGVGGGRSCS
ncbi:MAG: hypothetical protein NUW23_00895 [Firmicutes bacterium]|jgi:hypothetical protein|nr:hypothetical protein [Bacillota bacterium]